MTPHGGGCVLGAGAEGFASEGDQEEVRKVERQLKNRFPIGSHVSEQRIVQDFLKQVTTEHFSCCTIYYFSLSLSLSAELLRAGNTDSDPHHVEERRAAAQNATQSSLQSSLDWTFHQPDKYVIDFIISYAY